MLAGHPNFFVHDVTVSPKYSIRAFHGDKNKYSYLRIGNYPTFMPSIWERSITNCSPFEESA